MDDKAAYGTSGHQPQFIISQQQIKRGKESESLYTVLKVLFKNTMQYCLGHLVCIVREWSGKQRNGERIKRRKLKLKRVLKLVRWNRPDTPPFTYFVYLGNWCLKAVSGEFNWSLQKFPCLFCRWLRDVHAQRWRR